MKKTRRSLCCICLLLCCWLPGLALALDAPAAWMRADWTASAPHLADAGVEPAALGKVIGNRLILFRHPPRETVLPGPNGPRRFADTRYISAVARVDMPAEKARSLLKDFSAYRNIFPLITDSSVQAVDGVNVLADFRFALPLPIATFKMECRVKNRLEPDGSIVTMLVDGEARSVLAAIGGADDSLNNQPAESRWEVFALDDQHALIAFTVWSQIELHSWLAQKAIAEYPEIRELSPYIFSLGALEALRGKYSLPAPTSETVPSPGYAVLGGLRPYVERLSGNGQVVVVYPEPMQRPAGLSGPLRFVSVVMPINRPSNTVMRLATQYARLPEAFPELKKITATTQGADVNVDMRLRLGLSILNFPLRVSLLSHWAAPGRLEFQRSGGELEQVQGAMEWQAQGSNTLMLASAADIVGDDAPWMLRKFHQVVGQVPYAGAITIMTAQQISLLRLRRWIEAQPAVTAAK